MTRYTLTYQDCRGLEHNMVLEARSSTDAIIKSMEQLPELRLHPNRIIRIHKENKNG